MPLPWCYVPLPDRRRSGAPAARPGGPRLRKTHVKNFDDFKLQRRGARGENHKLSIAESRGEINVAETASRALTLDY
jgi:hypothetical protein